MLPDIHDRRVIVFGGTRGLGFEVAKAFVAAGAAVMVASRDESSVRRAQVLLSGGPHGHPPLAMRCDVTGQAEVDSVVAHALENWRQIDAVVNCAGVLGPVGLTAEVDWKLWRSAIEVNLLGPAVVSRAVIPHFRTTGRGKLVHLSGGGATRALAGMSSYCASKAGLVRLVETLAEEYRGSNIDVNAVAPGVLDTNMLDEVLAAGPERVGADYYDRMLKSKTNGSSCFDLPVALIGYLVSPLSDGVTGRLVSALWDPWQDPEAFSAALGRDNMFMLRRVDLNQA